MSNEPVLFLLGEKYQPAFDKLIDELIAEDKILFSEKTADAAGKAQYKIILSSPEAVLEFGIRSGQLFENLK